MNNFRVNIVVVYSDVLFIVSAHKYKLIFSLTVFFGMFEWRLFLLISNQYLPV